jgi:hypothetical protein
LPDVVDFSGVPKDIRSGGGGGHLPEGDYLVKIAKVEKKWKDNDRSNIPYYKWSFQTVDGAHKGTTVFHNTSLSTEALFNLRNLIYAVYKKNVAGSKMNFDPKKLIGKKIAITTQDREWTKPGQTKAKMYSDVVDMRPADELEQKDASYGVAMGAAALKSEHFAHSNVSAMRSREGRAIRRPRE